MNYNSLMNKPTINYRELIGDNTVTEVGGITEEQFNTLLSTDLSSYYTKAQIDDLFSRSYVYREKSGSIVTFDCPATPQNIPEVTAEIVAVQSGTGDPSPTNVRPITGWSDVNVVVSPTTVAEDGTTYTTTLKDGQGNPITCYGGTLDVVSGVLTVDRAYVDLGTLAWSYADNRFQTLGIKDLIKKPASGRSAEGLICSSYVASTEGNDHTFFKYATGDLYFYDSSYTSASDFKTAMSGVQLVYELANPQQIPQDSLSIVSTAGTNNLWCDSGDITVKALDKIIQE